MSTIIAVPSAMPGGLDALIVIDLGNSEIYTIVEAEDGKIKSVSTLENVPHQPGGCLAPVQHLASHNVNVLLAGGMGMRPLMGFQQEGEQVFVAGTPLNVGRAVNAFLAGQLQPFSMEFTCGGGHAH